MPESKPVLHSRTIIVNIAAITAYGVAYFWGPELGDWVRSVILETAPAVLAVVNIVLRFATTRPIV